ncbi:MAG: hypothetical protein MJK13_08255 [Pseudomonadales bacterium]|nr:hypothetical protein [Pseudomonadales bacterium]MCJ8339969.1 hypothetical protein [Pseudomonadales bacterium]NRA17636.1 hypothetical protein [Oceanospirillaceae bacterium]
MIKRPTKTEIRNSLAAQVNEYLNQGGQIKQFEQGDSSLIDGKYDRNQFVYGLPKQQRTPISQTLNVIDGRKKQHIVALSKKPKLRRVKKTIYDDFGEALREVWVDA